MEKLGLHEFGEKYQKNLARAPFIIIKNRKKAYIVLPYSDELEYKQEEGDSMELTPKGKDMISGVFKKVGIAIITFGLLFFGLFGGTVVGNYFTNLDAKVTALRFEVLELKVTPTVSASPSEELTPSPTTKALKVVVPAVTRVNNATRSAQ